MMGQKTQQNLAANLAVAEDQTLAKKSQLNRHQNRTKKQTRPDRQRHGTVGTEPHCEDLMYLHFVPLKEVIAVRKQ